MRPGKGKKKPKNILNKVLQISKVVVSLIYQKTKTMTTIKTLQSEVEINKELICVNDVLFYVDNDNAQKWTVTEVFEGGFEAKSEGETKDFYFNELQIGWSISEKSKKSHQVNERYIYN